MSTKVIRIVDAERAAAAAAAAASLPTSEAEAEKGTARPMRHVVNLHFGTTSRSRKRPQSAVVGKR